MPHREKEILGEKSIGLALDMNRWLNAESVEALLAIALGCFASIIGYIGLPVECRLFYSGSGTCFLSGSGGLWSMVILVVGILFLAVGVADLAIRVVRKN